MQRLQFKLRNEDTQNMEMVRNCIHSPEHYALILASERSEDLAENPSGGEENTLLMDYLARASGQYAYEETLEFLLVTESEIVTLQKPKGMCYYLVTRIEDAGLTRRERGEENQSAFFMSSLDETITTLCIKVGIPTHVRGFQYIHEAIKIVTLSPEKINRITKELYPGIATKFETTPSKVERSIRHAIGVLWTRGQSEAINSAFGYPVCKSESKLTNGEFIALLANHCRGMK